MSRQPLSPWPQAHPSPPYHLLPRLRLCSGPLLLDLALEISGNKLCPIFHPCSWCGGSASSCPWESVPHVGLKAGSRPRKGRGIPDNQKNLGKGSGITASTHPVTALSTHPSSGWVPKRVLGGPPYSSPNRIPQNQCPQQLITPQHGSWSPDHQIQRLSHPSASWLPLPNLSTLPKV